MMRNLATQVAASCFQVKFKSHWCQLELAAISPCGTCDKSIRRFRPNSVNPTKMKDRTTGTEKGTIVKMKKFMTGMKKRVTIQKESTRSF
jgi:hypothetical protein